MNIEYNGITYYTKTSWNVLIQAYCTMYNVVVVDAGDLISWGLKCGFFREKK